MESSVKPCSAVSAGKVRVLGLRAACRGGHLAVLLGTLLGLVSFSAPAFAQPLPPADAGDVVRETDTKDGFRFGALVQARYEHSWLDSSTRLPLLERQLDRFEARSNDGYRVERAFLRFGMRPTPGTVGRVVVDVAELLRKNQKDAVKFAYVEQKLLSRLWLRAGLFKRPFGLLELISVSEFEFLNLGPTDALIKQQGYAGRDTGLELKAHPFGKKGKYLSLQLASFAGGTKGPYASPVGLLSARAETQAVSGWRFGLGAAYRPQRSKRLEGQQDLPVDDLDKGLALGVDATGRWLGFESRLEGMYGRRTDLISMGASPVSAAGGDCPQRGCHFASVGSTLSRAIPLGKRLLVPAIRAEFLDANVETAGGRRSMYGAAVNFFPNPAMRFSVDLLRVDVSARANAFSQMGDLVTSRRYELSMTQLAVQVQLVY